MSRSNLFPFIIQFPQKNVLEYKKDVRETLRILRFHQNEEEFSSLRLIVDIFELTCEILRNFNAFLPAVAAGFCVNGMIDLVVLQVSIQQEKFTAIVVAVGRRRLELVRTIRRRLVEWRGGRLDNFFTIFLLLIVGV